MPTEQRVARAEVPEAAPDPTAAAEAATLEVPPELVAQSLGEWFRAWLTRIRSGDSGVLPVILALLIITIVFQAISPHNVFLSAGNLVNLFQQSAVFMVLAMGELFVILLGEIDLSIGYAGGVGAAVTVQLVQPATTKWPWWGAVLAGLLVFALIRALQGTPITPLPLSSLIVTPARPLILPGTMLLRLGPALSRLPRLGRLRRAGGRAVGDPNLPGRLRRLDGDPPATAVGAFRLRHRRESRGGAAGRHQSCPHSTLVFHDLPLHRRHRPPALRLLPRGHVR